MFISIICFSVVYFPLLFPLNITVPMWRRSIPRLGIHTPERSRVGFGVKPLFRQTKIQTPVFADSEEATVHGVETLLGGIKYKVIQTAKQRAAHYFIGVTTLFSIVAYLAYRKDVRDAKRNFGLVGPKSREYGSRLTVVLDVDETLVSYGDKAFRLKAGVVPRPYLAELLDYLVQIDAEVILWSSCSARYLEEVKSAIDPHHTKFSTSITRDPIWFTGDNYYEKNLMWLKRDMDNTIMIENRPLSVRGCNANSILVDDFIRGEYMDTGMDQPPNDKAMLAVKEVIKDIEEKGIPVPQYLGDAANRRPELKEIPCHMAIKMLPEELARGVFYFVGDKYKPGRPDLAQMAAERMKQ